jgi:hypothetical protein
MTDERIDVVLVEAAWLSPADIDSLGDSVLGGALRRLEADSSGGGSGTGIPIAAFQDSV